jgi:tellurite resistance protein TerC
VILGFIGAKLVIHALHTNELPFVNGGEHVTAIPEISTAVSLAVIVVTLLVTTLASLAKGRPGVTVEDNDSPSLLQPAAAPDPTVR